MKIRALKALLTWPLAMTLVTAGCGEKGARRPGIDPEPEAQAPKDIGASFLVEAGKESDANHARIAIARDSLGKEFLLQSSITIMPFLGTSNGNLSRVVTFRQIEDDLWMFDATTGNVATTDIPQTFVLAKFPIIAKTANYLFFDFNAGMTDLFVADEWRGTDFSGSDVKYDAKALKTDLSYLEAASITPANELAIRQIAQVDMPTADTATKQDHTTVEVRYYLTPYAPDPSFTPSEAIGFDKYGYFQVAPRYNDKGEAVINSTKFGNGPITYAISANTPDEVKDAVKEGILYWNKIFGEERLKVVDAPAGLTAPDFNYNIVQWVTWDDAGFAYADAQMDPRTGQTLHAQIYMTSVFWVSGQQGAKKWLDRVGANSPDQHGASGQPSVGLKGFQGGHLCMADSTKDFKALLTQLVAEEADDARIKDITRDYIREVVAHEVGHTLGLRHNFAGSLAANFPVTDLETVWKDYTTSGSAPLDKVTSNSVMEYQTFLNGTMTGDQIEKAPTALAYDRQAILNLYTGSEPEGSTPQYFCTDSSESQFADCKTFDEGASVAQSLVRSIRSANRILDGRVELSPGVAVPTAYLMDVDTVADAILAPLAEAAALASSNTKLIGVRQMSALPANVEPLLQREERDRLLDEINDAGGFDAILPLVTTLPDPVHPSLKPARDYLETRLAEKLLAILQAPTQIVDHALGAAFAAHLEKAARNVALAETGNHMAVTITKPDGSTSTVDLPEFKYSPEDRAKAVALLAPGRGVSQAFGLEQALVLKSDLSKKLKDALGTDVSDADLTTLTAEGRRWVVENQSVIGAFGR